MTYASDKQKIVLLEAFKKAGNENPSMRYEEFISLAKCISENLYGRLIYFGFPAPLSRLLVEFEEKELVVPSGIARWMITDKGVVELDRIKNAKYDFPSLDEVG